MFANNEENQTYIKAIKTTYKPVQIAYRKCLKHHKNLSKQLLKPLKTCKKQCGTHIRDLMTNPAGIIETGKIQRVLKTGSF